MYRRILFSLAVQIKKQERRLCVKTDFIFAGIAAIWSD